MNKDDITGFSQNYTDLRFGAAIDADNTKESSPVKALGKNIGSTQLKVYDVPKQEKLYLDHSIKQSKLQAIKNQESNEIKKLQNTKHSNKSSVTNKYYVPIYKRVDTELEKRKARLQKLTEQVLQEREVKDKFVSDQLFFPRTRMSYEVQNKHFYGTEKSIDANDEANKDLDDANHHKHRLSNKQMFANFMQDHQTWEMKKKRKIDKKLEEKETKIRSELTFTPRINQHSQKLASKRQGRVESRLLSVGCRTDERIKQIQNCQVLPFKPMIYDNQKKSRWQSACSGMMSQSSLVKNNDIPSLPPKPDVPFLKQKVQFKEHERMLYYEIQHEKNKIKNYSPVIISRTDSSFNTQQIDSI